MATSHIKYENKNEDDDLERMALEEIVKETKRAKERAQTMGPMGWVKCPLQPTNKRFFRNVIMGTMTNPRHNHKTTKGFKRGHERSWDTVRTVLESSDSSASKHETQDDQHSLSRFPGGNFPQHRRNLPYSERKKDKEQNSMKEKLPNTGQQDFTSDKEHKSSRKHKSKHKSKHKQKKKKKSEDFLS